MKIVTMCRGGNVRSVAAKMVLNRYFGHEVIAIGYDNTNNETKKLVFDWADRIVIMSMEIWDLALASHDAEYGHKFNILDVGQDVWGDPFKVDLQLKIFNLLIEETDFAYHINTYEKAAPIAAEIMSRIADYKQKIKSRNPTDTAL